VKRCILTISGAAALVLFATPRTAISQVSNVQYTLDVYVAYTGAGTVDDKHKIYVVLWDPADFVKGLTITPLAIKSTSSNARTVRFDHLNKTPICISAVYDSSGSWDTRSDPPGGSSMGLYSKVPGRPALVQLDSDTAARIDLSFGDSVKMWFKTAAK